MNQPFKVEFFCLNIVTPILIDNDVDIIKNIVVENLTNESFENVSLVIQTNPYVFSFDFSNLRFNPNEKKYLDQYHDYSNFKGFKFGEDSKVDVIFTLKQGDNILFSETRDILTFTNNYWTGIEFLPEFTSSFVNPVYESINKLGIQIHERFKDSNGVNSDFQIVPTRDNILKLSRALVDVYQEQRFEVVPSENFYYEPQYVLSIDKVAQMKAGSILELCFFVAGLMRKVSLNPVLIFTKEKLLLGCHIANGYLSNICTDDVSDILSLLDQGDLILFDIKETDFETSIKTAELFIRTESLSFMMAIDVYRAELSGIKKILLRSEVEDSFESLYVIKDVEQKYAPVDRVARWTQKLLDLSLRNRLLNVKDNSLSIPLISHDITKLEDALSSSGKYIQFKSFEKPQGDNDAYDLTKFHDKEVFEKVKKTLEEDFSRGIINALLTPEMLEKRLVKIFRQNKSDIDESGVNTLFLTLGLLEWKQSERDEKTYSAPIILVPVRIVRKNITSGYRIIKADEETIINETLLELLRSQFGISIPGLSPLPTDNSGVDVEKVFALVKAAIAGKKDWSVHRDTFMGLFSFGKYVMWSDMTARIDKLKENQLIKHIVDGGGDFDDGIEVFDPKDIGKHLDMSQVYFPMSADSSQMAAVLYSQMRKSFVLHGPPGTGKSQTITNLIAHNMALGRRVLFVSEKKAALDVVHRRLSNIGLKPFCLELHSNRAGKAEVLAQFAEALNVPEVSASKEWEKTVEDLESVRAQLNEYVNVLHKKYDNGLSAYDCVSRLLSVSKDEMFFDININCLEQKESHYKSILDGIGDASISFSNNSISSIKAFEWVDTVEWNPQREREFEKETSNLLERIARIETTIADSQKDFDLPFIDKVDSVDALSALMSIIVDGYSIPKTLLQSTDRTNNKKVEAFCSHKLSYYDLQEKLSSYDCDKIVSLDLDGIRQRIEDNLSKNFIVRFFKNRSLLKELNSLKKLGSKKLTIKELQAVLPIFEDYVKENKYLESNSKFINESFENVDNKSIEGWRLLQEQSRKANEVIEIVFSICSIDSSLIEILLNKLQEVMPRCNEVFAKGSSMYAKGNSFIEEWSSFREAVDTFLDKYASVSKLKMSDISEFTKILVEVIEHISNMRNVMIYKTQRDKLVSDGVSSIVGAMEKEEIDVCDVRRMFELSYARRMLDAVLNVVPELSSFSGATHDIRIEKFKELDDEYCKLTRLIIFAKLSSALPKRRTENCPEGSELGILKRECTKRSRHKPVRQLLEQIPNLATTLKPCFLMSPLSVAQYLPTDSNAFDLVVFDEASQIPVWDAIGVIARGKQLIVVGDPKQMPPTNFFRKCASDEALEEMVEEDLESILDECIASGVHSTYLNWHYRSKHESLIAFSNHHYYGDRLCTFPSSYTTERLGVRFNFVEDAIYDRRKTRTNSKEAEALVKYIFDRLEQSEKKRSIGVVTFSMAQKDMIEDMVEKERVNHPNLEEYFSDQNEESFFVKNLENVQGDERDVILFSIGYAPDATGAFSMNFGPLNRQGGERRLNVAITRAKEQVVVFSSIHSHQIDLNRTSALGAAHLKSFLEYAEKGISISVPKKTVESSYDGLIDTIEKFLVDSGYNVERNIGSSDYKLDAAVRNPDKPDQFILGIETDGVTYSNQNTARDRDILRSSVLGNLGWRIYRAWSIDWHFNRQQCEKHLLDLLESIRKGECINESRDVKKEFKLEDYLQKNISSSPRNHDVYNVWAWKRNKPQESFYDASSFSLIRKQLKDIIEIEAPIYKSLIQKRLVKSWGFVRSGENIQGVIDLCMPLDSRITKGVDGDVYWGSKSPSDFVSYRVSADDKYRRALEEIPPEEIANAMKEIITDFGICDKELLFKETAKIFGCVASGIKNRTCLEASYKMVDSSK